LFFSTIYFFKCLFFLGREEKEENDVPETKPAGPQTDEKPDSTQ